MSSRPSSNKPFGTLLRFVVVAAFVALFFYVFTRQNQPSPAPQVNHRAPPGPVQSAQPPINPIERQLAPTSNVQPTEGVVVAVLMDVSGSMGNAVRDSDGTSRPKIETARHSILDVLRKTDAFAKEHPEKHILLGVYEFSSRPNAASCRNVIPLQAPDLKAAEAAVTRMEAEGGTPIGDAIIVAKRDLDKTGFSHLHILVVTDGENNQGYAPGDVVNAISRMDERHRASVYFIAFDVAAAKFNAVRENGGLVLSASNAQELQQTLDYVLTGKILAEQPSAPRSQ